MPYCDRKLFLFFWFPCSCQYCPSTKRELAHGYRVWSPRSTMPSTTNCYPVDFRLLSRTPRRASAWNKLTNKLEPWQRCILLPKQALGGNQSVLICSGIVMILVLPQDPFIAWLDGSLFEGSRNVANPDVVIEFGFWYLPPMHYLYHNFINYFACSVTIRIYTEVNRYNSSAPTMNV